VYRGPRSLFDDPDLFLYRLDVSRDRAWFVWMSRDSYRASALLDARIRRHRTGGLEVRLHDLARAAPSSPRARPCRYIFHIGHTCSTLLARAVGELPGSLVLREPGVLTELAKWSDRCRSPRRFTPERWQALRESVLLILSKTYRKGDIAVIKPSSLANGGMQDALVSRSSRRALFVYSSLSTFLASMLKSEDNRLDGIADLAARLRTRGGRIRAASLRRQPIARKLAALWIAHMDLFLDLVPRVPASRLRSLDADDFIAAPADSLSHLGRFFGFDWPAADIASLVDGPIFRGYSKYPRRPFDAHARNAEMRRAREAWGAEIDDASAWAARVTRDRPIPDVLPRRLASARAA
jgi:hypothetical protein